MRYCHYLIFLFVLTTSTINAQKKAGSEDITGLWKGTLYNDTTKQYYRYEVAVTENKGKLSGYSHTWVLKGDKRYYGLKKVKVKKAKDGKIIIEDNGLIANNYPEEPNKNVRQLNVLTLYITEDIMSLDGPFATNQTKEFTSLTGSVSLKKQNDYWQSDLVPHLQELGIVTNLSFVQNDLAFISPPKMVFDQMSGIEQIPGITPENDIRISTSPEPINNVSENNIKPILVVEPATKEEDKNSKATVVEQFKIIPVDQEKEIPQDKKENIQKEVKTDIKQSVTAKNVAVKNEPTPGKSVITQNNQASNNEKNAIANKQLPSLPDVVRMGAITKKEPVNVKDDKTSKMVKTAVNNEEKSPQIINNESKTTMKVAKNQEQLKTTGSPVIPTPIISEKNTAALEVSSRNNVIQQTVYFSSDSLQISLFDNGEVDGDTVSVLMNGNLIIAKQRLSTNAFRKTIYLEKTEDSIQLIMYAENLGSISPNTGLLVVRDGKDIYEIRFRGDLQKNAAIILRRKK